MKSRRQRARQRKGCCATRGTGERKSYSETKEPERDETFRVVCFSTYTAFGDVRGITVFCIRQCSHHIGSIGCRFIVGFRFIVRLHVVVVVILLCNTLYIEFATKVVESDHGKCSVLHLFQRLRFVFTILALYKFVCIRIFRRLRGRSTDTTRLDTVHRAALTGGGRTTSLFIPAQTNLQARQTF